MGPNHEQEFSIIKTDKKLMKKMQSLINVEKGDADFYTIQKVASKRLMPLIEKSIGVDDLTFLRMQIVSIGDRFFNTDSYYHCLTSPTYSCLLCLEEFDIFLVPKKHVVEKSSLGAYKSKQLLSLKRGHILVIPSDMYYCLADAANGVGTNGLGANGVGTNGVGTNKVSMLKIYDIMTRTDYELIKDKMKTVSVIKGNFLQNMINRVGISYQSNRHYLYKWFHFAHYCSVKNGFQHKICLTDIPPDEKSECIVSYEDRPRIYLKRSIRNGFDTFIALDNHINHMVPDNFYLFQFVKWLIFIMVVIVVVIFWKDTEIRIFLSGKL